MRHVEINRFRLKDQPDPENYTLGNCYVTDDTGFLGLYGYTIEPPVRANKPKAIPTGKYNASIEYKNQTPRIRLKDVPGFTGILIHVGNSVADTTGCVVLGQDDNGSIKSGWVKDSAESMHNLVHLGLLDQEKTTVRIIQETDDDVQPQDGEDGTGDNQKGINIDALKKLLFFIILFYIATKLKTNNKRSYYRPRKRRY